MLGLADLAKVSTNIQAGSQEFLANLNYPGFLDGSKRLRDKWGELSQRLLAYDPRSILGTQLGYFAVDGGIGKLRELLQSHVAAHGLKQLYADTQKAAGLLRREQDTLGSILEQIDRQGIPVPEENTAFVSLRQTIDSLLGSYRDFEQDLRKKPLQDRRGVTVSDVVYDELTFKIFNWDKWNVILQRASKGIIKLPEARNILDEMFPELDKSDDSGIATKSDDFYPPFAQTIQELEKFARDRLQVAIADLLNGFSAKIAQERNQLSEILPSEIVQQRMEQIKEKYGSARLLQILVNFAIHPDRFQEQILKLCQLQENGQSTIEPEKIFPLARGDDNKSGQIFDWGRENKEIPRPFNHQILVLRLRDEMISSAGLHLVGLVSDKNQLLNNTLGELLNQMIDSLNQLLRNEALLRDIAAEDMQTNNSVPPWLQTLSQIVSSQ